MSYTCIKICRQFLNSQSNVYTREITAISAKRIPRVTSSRDYTLIHPILYIILYRASDLKKKNPSNHILLLSKRRIVDGLFCLGFSVFCSVFIFIFTFL